MNKEELFEQAHKNFVEQVYNAIINEEVLSCAEPVSSTAQNLLLSAGTKYYQQMKKEDAIKMISYKKIVRFMVQKSTPKCLEPIDF